MGDPVEARDKGNFFQAKIIAAKPRKSKRSGKAAPHFLVHFDGWNKRFDTWLEPDDLQPVGTAPLPKRKAREPAAAATKAVSQKQPAKKRYKPAPRKTAVAPSAALSTTSPRGGAAGGRRDRRLRTAPPQREVAVELETEAEKRMREEAEANRAAKKKQAAAKKTQAASAKHIAASKATKKAEAAKAAKRAEEAKAKAKAEALAARKRCGPRRR
eukprot:SAG22_NODE_70_length_22717_cov_12.413741_9_plen_214_part_00